MGECGSSVKHFEWLIRLEKNYVSAVNSPLKNYYFLPKAEQKTSWDESSHAWQSNINRENRHRNR